MVAPSEIRGLRRLVEDGEFHRRSPPVGVLAASAMSLSARLLRRRLRSRPPCGAAASNFSVSASAGRRGRRGSARRAIASSSWDSAARSPPRRHRDGAEAVDPERLAGADRLRIGPSPASTGRGEVGEVARAPGRGDDRANGASVRGGDAPTKCVRTRSSSVAAGRRDAGADAGDTTRQRVGEFARAGGAEQLGSPGHQRRDQLGLFSVSSRPISNSAASEMSSRPSGTACAAGRRVRDRQARRSASVRTVGCGLSGPRYQDGAASPRRVRCDSATWPVERDLGHRRVGGRVDGAEQADFELVHQPLEAARAGADELPRDQHREAAAIDDAAGSPSFMPALHAAAVARSSDATAPDLHRAGRPRCRGRLEPLPVP